MEIIRLGSKGSTVERWQTFLRGQVRDVAIVMNGTFDDVTLDATKRFQSACGLTADGIVGLQTYASAMKRGFDPGLVDDRIDSGPNWPIKPDGVNALDGSTRDATFEPIRYVARPTTSNPEAIEILDGWEKRNLTTATIEQLAGITGVGRSGTVQFHVKCAAQLVKLFQDWEDAGLKDRILTFGGTWAPRFIRGSTSILSQHAYATAFDINVEWNALGTIGALKGQKGSNRELVELAVKNGFFWGGWFKHRSDPMHFEAFRIARS